MTSYINMTPHAIILNNGEIHQPSGTITRVTATFSKFDEDLTCKQVFGEVSDLPEPKPDTIYIVSGLVLAALGQTRSDVVAPATGHPECKRNTSGQIISVPGFVRC